MSAAASTETDPLAGLSPTALKALRELAREAMPTCSHPMGGNARGPVLSSCRSLVRKGLMWSPGGSRFGLTAEGVPVAYAALARWKEEREAAKAAGSTP